MVIYPYVTYIYIIIIWNYLQDRAQYSHVASSLPSSLADEAMSKYLFGAVATCGPWSGALESTLGLEQDILNGDFHCHDWRFP